MTIEVHQGPIQEYLEELGFNSDQPYGEVAFTIGEKTFNAKLVEWEWSNRHFPASGTIKLHLAEIPAKPDQPL